VELLIAVVALLVAATGLALTLLVRGQASRAQQSAAAAEIQLAEALAQSERSSQARSTSFALT
jgi:hypothetical protein